MVWKSKPNLRPVESRSSSSCPSSPIPCTDQRRIAEVRIDRLVGFQSAIAGPEAYLYRHAARLCIIGPKDRLHAIGKFDLLDIEHAERTLRGDFARLANCGQIVEGNRLRGDARIGIGLDRFQQRGPDRLAARFIGSGGDIGGADHVAGEQRTRMIENEFGRDKATDGSSDAHRVSPASSGRRSAVPAGCGSVDEKR